jgi:hypothetical protein
MTYKDFWITIAIVSVLSFIIGIQLCRYNHKEQIPIIYDLEYLTDSILAANKHSDSIIVKIEKEIKYEKGKLIERFVFIDSLSFDSAYSLWQQSARFYKPYAN